MTIIIIIVISYNYISEWIEHTYNPFVQKYVTFFDSFPNTSLASLVVTNYGNISIRNAVGASSILTFCGSFIKAVSVI
jgi:hypothetical protein